MKKKSIFIASTGQNVGKTTVSLGLVSGLKKRFSHVGFIKPIGQTLVEINNIKVDKDVALFRECFSLKTDAWAMSPVVLPPGFTRDFLDKKQTLDHLKQNIVKAYEQQKALNDFMVIEGTGHTAVGSIIGLNNAYVAKTLNAEMIIVASGGLGSSFDELMLNIALCEKEGAKIRGVILNKVLDSKREMILEYYPKALSRLNIPLLGIIAYNEFLSAPCMKDFATLFDTEQFSGQEHAFRHFKRLKVADTSLKLFKDDPLAFNQLIITSATRHDVILSTLAKFWNKKIQMPSVDLKPGLILTGTIAPSKELMEKIKKTHIPALYTPLSSYNVLEKIAHLTTKIRLEDTSKVYKAIDIVESSINFDALIS
jgi:phosphate acetyltransferase